MLHKDRLRHLVVGALASVMLAAAGLTAPVIPGAVRTASAQVSADFQEALAPYGQWIRHPRWGMVWVADAVPPDWRPYQYGHWVYTEEWGWYWVSDPEEEDWGWVVFHYGRWAHERRLGWFWIPGDEWAPAWVDWRFGGDHVGWAPLPPDELIVAYDNDPTYWVFVPPRYLTAPRLRTYYLPPSRRVAAFRDSRVVNRSVAFGRGRAAVNPGLSPAFVARVSRTAVPTYRVNPRVLTRTQGVANAVQVTPEQLRSRPAGAQRDRRPSASRANAVTVQPTATTIAPDTSATAPQPLGRGERGQLGNRPPRAAQGGAPASPPTPAAQPQPPSPQQPAASPAAPPAAAPPAAAPPPAATRRPTTPTPPAAAPTPSPAAPAAAPSPAAAPRQPPSNGGPPPQQRRLERRDQRPPEGAAAPPPAQVKPAQPAEPRRPAQARPAPPAAVKPPPPPAAAKPPPPAAKPPPPAAAKPPPPAAAHPPPPAKRPPPAAAKPAPQPAKPEETPK